MLLFGKPCDYDEDIVETASAAVSLAAPETGNGVRVRGHRRNAVSAPCNLQPIEEHNLLTAAPASSLMSAASKKMAVSSSSQNRHFSCSQRKSASVR